MDLGRVLLEMGCWTAVRSVWEQHAGNEFENIEPLLLATGELAGSIPLDGYALPVRVVSHDDDTHVAVLPDGAATVSLTRGDIVLWSLKPEMLLESIISAAALQGLLERVPVSPTIWRAGTCATPSGALVPVYASVALSPAGVVRDSEFARTLARGQFILLSVIDEVPSLAAQAVAARDSAAISIDRAFAWQSAGVIWCPTPFSSHLPPSMRKSPVNRPGDLRTRVAIPEGTRWSDVQMSVEDMDTILVRIAGDQESITPRLLGLTRSRSGKPRDAWAVLSQIIKAGGTLRPKPIRQGALQKQIEIVRKTLQGRYPIAGNPIIASDAEFTTVFHSVRSSNAT